MSLKSQNQGPSSKSLPEDLCSGFLRPEKIHLPDLNPRTMDLEESTLPRDHRGLHEGYWSNIIKETENSYIYIKH